MELRFRCRRHYSCAGATPSPETVLFRVFNYGANNPADSGLSPNAVIPVIRSRSSAVSLRDRQSLPVSNYAWGQNKSNGTYGTFFCYRRTQTNVNTNGTSTYGPVTGVAHIVSEPLCFFPAFKRTNTRNGAEPCPCRRLGEQARCTGTCASITVLSRARFPRHSFSQIAGRFTRSGSAVRRGRRDPSELRVPPARRARRG